MCLASTVGKGGSGGPGGGRFFQELTSVEGVKSAQNVIKSRGLRVGKWIGWVFIVILLCTIKGTEAAFASAPTVVPSSLVAGAVGTNTVSFTTGTDLPNNGKIVIEFPTTFAAVGTDTTSKFGSMGAWFIVR